jgi:hypothetical protein
VTGDKFTLVRPELGKTVKGVSVHHDHIFRGPGKKFHKLRMPRANAPWLSEKQHVRMTIDASQLLFDRRERVESCGGKFEIAKLFDTRRKRRK